MTDDADIEVREGTYGDRVIAVEPGGAEFIPLRERHGRPLQLFWTWTSPKPSKAHPAAPHHAVPGAFLLTLGATFGYAVGWNPYASDYTRYYRPDVNKFAVAWWAGFGLFLSCTVLEIVGAAAGTLTRVAAGVNSNPTGAFTSVLPSPLADVTLCAIALGAVAASWRSCSATSSCAGANRRTGSRAWSPGMCHPPGT